MTDTGQWFPGHMAKALRQLKTELGKIHGVVEVLDARAAEATRNPKLEDLFPDIPHILALNKADLADPRSLQQTINRYQKKGLCVIPITSKKGLKGLKPLVEACQKQCVVPKKLEGFQYTQKVVIVGIPNVGKSSVINAIRGGQSAKIGNKPGVTKHLKWIEVTKHLVFCDSPGILWPKVDSEEQLLQLSALNCIKEERLERHKLCEFIISFMLKEYRDPFLKRYELPKEIENLEEILDHIAFHRKFLLPDNQIDEKRLYTHIILEFQAGKFGRISF